MASILEVICPTDVDGVLSVLGESDRNPRVVAGGTDLLLQYQHWSGPDVTIVDITGVRSLSEIIEEDGGLRIGATVRLSDIIGSAQVAHHFPVLIEGAVVVAGPQIRNLATIGGNVCNASPSADTVAPLLVLDAVVRLLSGSGKRSVPLCEFFAAPGQTVLEPGELLESIWIPLSSPKTKASYTKLSPRRAMDLAVVGVAVALWREDSSLRTRIGLGAVAPTPLRAFSAEDVVNGAGGMDSVLAEEAGQEAAADASPISDVRGSARYRAAMVERLVARSLQDLGGRLKNGNVGE
ncbi:MAG: xanthine dehydrogenase family protein subunit M [Acidimicrobiia bacterium]|nr:MAG: xanthine dehydrogenase family protein subunit M [Acidimicrobiia bacterium]